MATTASERASLQEFIPADYLDGLAVGRREDFLQPLMDLGYLERGLYHPEVVARALSPAPWPGPAYQYVYRAVDQALQAFRLDAVELGLLKPSEVAAHLEDIENHALHPGSMEMDLLLRLVAFDGEFIFSEFPDLGEVSLRSRQLQYRLDVLGLQDQDVGSPFSAADVEAFEQLGKWMEEDKREKVLQVIGDVDALSDQLVGKLKDSPMGRPLAFFRLDESPFPTLGNRPRLFRRELRRNLPFNLWEAIQSLINIKSFVRYRVVNLNELNARRDSAENHLLLRLLQVQLWSRGHYQGRLDAEIGPLTLEALQDHIEMQGEKADTYLLNLGTKEEDHSPDWAVNIKGLFDGFRPRRRAPKGMGDMMEELEKDLGQLAPEEREAFQWKLQEVHTHSVADVQENMQSGRRSYPGIRGWLQAFARRGRRLLDFLREGFKKVTRFLGNVVRSIKRYIREGLRVLGSGFHFLFSSRQFTAYSGDKLVLLSDFDADFDLVTLAAKDVDPATVDLHKRHLDRVARNLYISLDIAGMVLGWAVRVAAAGFTWPSLVLYTARILRRKLAGRWRNIGSSLAMKVEALG